MLKAPEPELVLGFVVDEDLGHGGGHRAPVGTAGCRGYGLGAPAGIDGGQVDGLFYLSWHGPEGTARRGLNWFLGLGGLSYRETYDNHLGQTNGRPASLLSPRHRKGR